MKQIITLCLLCISWSISAQLLENGSFEDGAGASLDNWTDQCNLATSSDDVPPGGGNWSLELRPGNTQSCFPGYFYQIVPVQANQTYLLQAWVKTDVINTPASINFGKIDEFEQLAPTSSDTTSASEWTLLEVQGTFNFGLDEQPVVILSGGLTGGPGLPGAAYFDLVDLSFVDNTTEPELPRISTFPNPTSEALYVHWSHSKLKLLETLVVDMQGVVYPIESIPTGKYEFKMLLEDLPEGMYALQFISDGGSFVEKLVKVGN